MFYAEKSNEPPTFATGTALRSIILYSVRWLILRYSAACLLFISGWAMLPSRDSDTVIPSQCFVCCKSVRSTIEEGGYIRASQIVTPVPSLSC